MSNQPEALRLADLLQDECGVDGYVHDEAAAELRRLAAVEAQRDALLEALRIAEAALSDIGDADREPGDDVAWCEARAAEAIPQARAAIKAVEEKA